MRASIRKGDEVTALLRDHSYDKEPRVTRIRLTTNEAWAGDLIITCADQGDVYTLKSVNGRLTLQQLEK